MSEHYQVLARKYRPHKFEELVGQTHTIKTLVNALDNNNLHHGFLFTGTRGVGKLPLHVSLQSLLIVKKGSAQSRVVNVQHAKK